MDTAAKAVAVGPSTTTAWGCEIEIYPRSLAPRSLHLHHSPTCRCRGHEKVLVKDYILKWVEYRIIGLNEHPIKAATWARAACECLGIEGIDGTLNRIEALYDLRG